MAENGQIVSFAEERKLRTAAEQAEFTASQTWGVPERGAVISFGLPVQTASGAGSTGGLARILSGFGHTDERLEAREVVERSPQPSGLIDAFVKTCIRWRFERPQQAILLGYKGNEVTAEHILSGRLNIPSQDVLDRVGYVLAISLTLGSVFNEVVEPEIAWLAAKRRALGGSSARETLLGGRMMDLWSVLSLARTEGEFG